MTVWVGAEVPGYLAPTTALVLAAAVVGYLSVRSRVVPIVGFLVAGVIIGPAQLGLVSSTEAVDAAAEVGVLLLLFTIGIEFSLQRLARVWRWIAFGGGAQVALATAAGVGLTVVAGGDLRTGVFTGFLVALSSTAIVLKLLGDAGGMNTDRGRLALAVLIFQDLAVVAMVLVVPVLGTGSTGGLLALARALGVAVLVVAGVLLVARRAMPPLLERIAALCSPEVFLLAVVALCLGTAYLTALAGVSVSLGAFLAGLMVSESRHSTHAFSEVLPLQIIFSAVFFVSVGMLLDLGFLVTNLPLVLGAALVVLVVKTLTTTVALLPLKVGWRSALSAGLLLGQVGEFSFVLVTAGAAVGLSPAGLGEDGAQAFVATTVLLMVATPALAALGTRLAATGRTRRSEAVDAPEDLPGGDHVLVLGWGADSVDLARELQGLGVTVVMTTLNPGGAREADAAGIPVVRGDAMRAHVLTEAGIERARAVVIAEDDHEQAARLAVLVRRLTAAPVLVRPQGTADLADLAGAGVDHVIDAAQASRWRLFQAVLDRLEIPRPAIPAPGTGDRSWVDTTRLVSYAWPGDACPHGAGSAPVLPRSGGCLECLREGDTWVHLRICLGCGNVGCCDSSPGRHARAHHEATEHPLMTSGEPGETWAHCFLDDVTVPGPVA
ncbi:cation:proton antiporter [Nocardioides donggukensis]|uniref:Cation:proton antiporter n=1 Tax=Nocardioides donggukensis TaxID=2774019 RepID=A0A927K439_9ACTN|nr:cation:proton antiporter [Nocardioides donggukensis]MBD8868670.1 cation:proton antiporter [Nocardioides donggukensis]